MPASGIGPCYDPGHGAIPITETVVRVFLGLAWVFAGPLLVPGLAQTSWVRQEVPITDGLHGVFFADENHGWAFTYGTGTVLATRDGGRQWRVVHRFPGFENGFYFEQIQFKNPQTGWICGEGYVFRTGDGGESWQEISPNVPGRIRIPKKDNGGTRRVLYYAMHFFADGTGLVSGMKLPQEEGKERTPLLFSTNDRGDRWREVPQAPAMFLSFSFPGGETGYAGGREGIWATSDLGETWRKVFSDESRPKVGQIRSIHCRDERILWACGFGGVVLHSSDAGATWGRVDVTPNRLRGMLFVDAQRGFLCGDRNKEPSVLFSTRDAGRSWQPFPLESPDLHRLFATSKRLWAVGKEGTLLSLSLDEAQ